MIAAKQRIEIAQLDAGIPMEGFEALESQTQWDIAFASALLAVERVFMEADAAESGRKR